MNKPYYRLVVDGLNSNTLSFLRASGKCETAPVVWEGEDPFKMPVSTKDQFLSHLFIGDRARVTFVWQDLIEGLWSNCDDPLERPY